MKEQQFLKIGVLDEEIAPPRASSASVGGALEGQNAFAVLLDTVKTASLGQISEALFEVGGRYRRAM